MIVPFHLGLSANPAPNTSVQWLTLPHMWFYLEILVRLQNKTKKQTNDHNKYILKTAKIAK